MIDARSKMWHVIPIMKRSIIVLLAGVALTVGVYEGARAVRRWRGSAHTCSWRRWELDARCPDVRGVPVEWRRCALCGRAEWRLCGLGSIPQSAP